MTNFCKIYADECDFKVYSYYVDNGESQVFPTRSHNWKTVPHVWLLHRVRIYGGQELKCANDSLLTMCWSIYSVQLLIRAGDKACIMQTRGNWLNMVNGYC